MSITELLDIPPGSKHPALLRGEAHNGRRRRRARESKSLPVNTSGPQSPRPPWLRLSDSASGDARPPYIQNSTPRGQLVHTRAPAPLRLSASSAFQAAPTKIITAESCIQMINP